MFRDLLFDLDGTLLNFAAGEQAAFTTSLCEIGVTPVPQMYARYSAINDGFWKRFERGEIERVEIVRGRFRVWSEEFGIPLDPVAFNERYLDHLAEQGIPMDGAVELLTALAPRYALYLISNGLARVQSPRMAQAGIDRFFRGCFVSSEMGVQKPDRAFFDHVAAAIPDFDPTQALVIGDSLSSDIRGANNAGLPCCWFNPNGAARPADLRIDFEVRSLSELSAILLG